MSLGIISEDFEKRIFRRRHSLMLFCCMWLWAWFRHC